MFSVPQSALQRVRFIGHRWFHIFGIHCATHQIRVILISAVVITSLLFPAIHLYFPSQIHTFALRLHALDSFLTPDDISSYFSQQDTRSIWEGHHDLHVREDNVARARCGVEGLLRLERVLVHSPFHDGPSSALNKETLLATLDLENRIAEVLKARKLPCLRTRDGSCLSISPLAYWNHDAELLASDTNILDTISSGRNVSSSSILIHPDMVLAGREASDLPGRDVESAMFLVLSFFFPDTDCLGNVGHFAWLHALEDAVSTKGELILQARVPDLIALDYRANSRNSRTSVLSLFSYVVYSAFAVYFYRSIRRMDKVHSRLGLAFTGIVEIFVSTLTSLSMCYLAGFKFTLIPWEIFPIVVIFIGVENMFSLIDAVVKTSITLPVKIRVAEGLSRAGTSNSLKLFWYNAVLGLIAGVSTGAIQQFCTFAVAVLVAHWFLVHTFFVTVLSIDIQRLELEELLRQDSSISPGGSNDSLQAGDRTPDTRGAKFLAVLRGRPAKNISLVLLLAITATLYYATLPSHVRVDATRGVSSKHTKLRKNTDHLIPEFTTPAYNVWRVLNPMEDEMVHVRMESPAIIILNSEDTVGITHSSKPDRNPIKDYDWSRRSKPGLFFARLMRPVAWFFKIVVVPMIITIIALYGLLLYLLKDAELLEVQRTRAAVNETEAKEDPEPPANIPVTYGALPRAFPTDIDLVASNDDGSIVISVGLQNELVLWRKQKGTVGITVIDTSDIVLGSGSGMSAASTLTALAVNEDGTFCAVGSGTGTIAAWYIGKESVRPLQCLSVENNISAVTSIQFAPKSSSSNRDSGHASPTPGISLSTQLPPLGSMYAAYENGTVIQWTVTSFVVPSYVPPTRSASVSKALLETMRHDGRIIIGFALEDGVLEILDVEQPDDLLCRDLCIAAGNPSDLVNKLQICKVELEGEQRIIIAASTHAGVVSLWDGRTAECIYILDEPFGDISSLRLVPSPTEICGICGEHPFENFVLALSAGQLILFYRAYLSNPTRRCSCVHNQPKPQLRASVLGRRSRSGSAASTSGVMTPNHNYCRSRISIIAPSTPTQEEPPMFPVSAHGVHSRRSSDKEILRRNLENFVASDQDESDLPLGPQDITAQASSTFLSSDNRSSVWQNLVVVRIDDTTCERGGWDVVETKGGYYKVVGVRRKPRPPFVRPKARSSKTSPPKVQLRSQGPTGLTPSDLERWEFWTFNPSDSKLEASLLQSLRDHPLTVPSVRSKNILGSGGMPLSPRRRAGWEMIPRLHFTRVSPVTGGKLHCLAGFGNTVVSFDFDSHSLLTMPAWTKPTQTNDQPREASHH